MGKPIYVLGLSYSHDSSACLLKDGLVVAAIQRERLTRKKHDGSILNINLDECIRYCLEKENIALGDLDLVVENSPTVLYCKEKDSILGFSRPRMLDGMDQKKIFQISHHLAHAYCAYGLSGFDECAAMVIDGQGNYKEDVTEDLERAVVFPKDCEPSYIERESFYEFKKGKFKVARKNFGTIHKSFVRICGLGHLYETVAAYLFLSRFDAGKVMGLAPYGGKLLPFNMISLRDNSEIIYHNEWVKEFRNPNRYKTALEENWREYADLAMKVQADLEIGMMALTKWFRQNTSSRNLCYSGGVALNCSGNRRILMEGGFDNFFVAPPASDCGISIGCAYYGYFNVLGEWRSGVKHEYLDYAGKEYPKNQIMEALSKYGDRISFSCHENIAVQAAELMANGKIVAWFQGGSEFGPRALGNRSIVGDPRNPQMLSKMNQIKKREAFRPLAPSVLGEMAGEYFDINYSPYMLLNARVKEDKKKAIPAVTHVDGTARIQTVNQKQNKRYYSLINEFYKITKVPVIIDTSFNIDGPIAETPEDALECFVNSEIDYLCIGDFIVTRR